MAAPKRSFSKRSSRLAGLGRRLAAGVAALGLLAVMPAAVQAQSQTKPPAKPQLEGAVQRAARSGQLVLSGFADVPPLMMLSPQGQPSGYGILVAERIAAELSQAVGRPVSVRFAPISDPASLVNSITSGKADLACGLPFSWAVDMQVDFSLPIGLSGVRLLAPNGRFDGSPAALAGRRIGVVRQSLGETELRGMQPKATPVAFDSLKAAVAAMQAGTVEGVIGDTIVLAGLVRQQGLPGLQLSPPFPYEAYAVSCVLAENDSAFRNVVNLAIARLLQGYLDGQPDTVTAVNRWLGPASALGLPESAIRASFEAVLLGVETIRPVLEGQAASTGR
ncbi:extracellular substrate binding-like orphan protein GrrP [Cyanobium sp. BA5m-21]|uniref:extracellular substrate binding-like orphan protein GrrP n=1 Tax=Cyanobium sp. BA5m-21 TaxID=2823706 RepID=UPI0020CD77A5|nr:extracellular substrate binding-like orphan protein GrrP [Cyanobium sp. BA5m-21]